MRRDHSSPADLHRAVLCHEVERVGIKDRRHLRVIQRGQYFVGTAALSQPTAGSQHIMPGQGQRQDFVSRDAGGIGHQRLDDGDDGFIRHHCNQPSACHQASLGRQRRSAGKPRATSVQQHAAAKAFVRSNSARR